MNLGMFRRLEKVTHEALQRGSRLTEEEIQRLADRLAASPGDRDARLALIGARLLATESKVLHIVWFIENEPWTSLGDQAMFADPIDRAALATAWRRALLAHPDDPRVVENAAWFDFLALEPLNGLEALDAYCSRHPDDADGWEVLASYAAFVVKAGSAGDAPIAERCIEAASRALRLSTKPDSLDWLLLEVRLVAKTSGNAEALRLLDLAEKARMAAVPDDPDEREQAISPSSSVTVSGVRRSHIGHRIGETWCEFAGTRTARPSL
jgi:hypothetical protein